jgi:hypothetical protein
MGDPIFVDGIPAQLTAQEFLRYHLQQFPKLARPENAGIIEEALASVYAMFYGVSDIWNIHTPQVWYNKTVLCYRLLVAWYIADTNPKMLSGLPAMGGIPLKRKKIGDIDITFADTMSAENGNYQDLLASLKSNPFGHKAYLMLRAAGKRVMIRGRTMV